MNTNRWVIAILGLLVIGAYTGAYIADQQTFALCAKDGKAALFGGGVINCNINLRETK